MPIARPGALQAIDPAAARGTPGIKIVFPDGSVFVTDGALGEDAAMTAEGAGLKVQRGENPWLPSAARLKESLAAPSMETPWNPSEPWTDPIKLFGGDESSAGSTTAAEGAGAYRSEPNAILGGFSRSPGRPETGEPMSLQVLQDYFAGLQGQAPVGKMAGAVKPEGMELAGPAATKPSAVPPGNFAQGSVPAIAPPLSARKPAPVARPGAGSAAVSSVGGAPGAAATAASGTSSVSSGPQASAPMPQFDATKTFQDLWGQIGQDPNSTDLTDEERKNLFFLAGMGMLSSRGNFPQALGQGGLLAYAEKQRLGKEKRGLAATTRGEKIDLAKHVTDLAVKDADYRLNAWKAEQDAARYGRQDLLELGKMGEASRHNKAIEGAAYKQAEAAVLRAQNAGLNPSDLDEEFSRAMIASNKERSDRDEVNAWITGVPVDPSDPELEAIRAVPNSPAAYATGRLKIAEIQEDLTNKLAEMKRDEIPDDDPRVREIKEDAAKQFRELLMLLPGLLDDEDDPAIME